MLASDDYFLRMRTESVCTLEPVLVGLPAIEQYHKVILERGPDRVSPFFIPMVIINLASGQIAIRFGAKGPNSCAVTACATGNHCIGDGLRIIQRNEADAMIVGGAESTICATCHCGIFGG